MTSHYVDLWMDTRLIHDGDQCQIMGAGDQQKRHYRPFSGPFGRCAHTLYRTLGGGWSPEYDPLMDPNKDRTVDTS
jgi:hypothetical protein